MRIRAFFHKIKMGFVRAAESSIPCVDEAKRYGNYSEEEFTYMLQSELPFCKLKRNVVVSTDEGNAELDCLLLYENKLFAIEVKHWKGCLTELEDGFIQEKTDRWTGETYTKILKSPFKQLGRSIYLLRKQISTKAWLNAIVFFDNEEGDSVSVISHNVWFDRYQDIVAYIKNGGKASFGTSAIEFFDKCVPADYIYAKAWDKSLRCIINRDTLQFSTRKGVVPVDKIVSIRIYHHWSYDELYVRLSDGTESVISLENGKIQVNDNGRIGAYALCKLDYIELGKELTK